MITLSVCFPDVLQECVLYIHGQNEDTGGISKTNDHIT